MVPHCSAGINDPGRYSVPSREILLYTKSYLTGIIFITKRAQGMQ
jgi:hypothetical protein